MLSGKLFPFEPNLLFQGFPFSFPKGGGEWRVTRSRQLTQIYIEKYSMKIRILLSKYQYDLRVIEFDEG